MPFALILIGLILLVAGLRGTHIDLLNLVETDFTEQGGFLTWVAAIAVIGGLGYIPRFKSLSVAFMTLLLVVLVLSNGGIFAKLQQFISSGAGGRGKTISNDNADTKGDVLGSLSDAANVALNIGKLAAIA